MNTPVTIASAGNTLAAAYATLRKLGYKLTNVEGTELLRAQGQEANFVAEDPLLLLGLVKLRELRGDNWQPTKTEVEEFVLFEQGCGQ